MNLGGTVEVVVVTGVQAAAFEEGVQAEASVERDIGGGGWSSKCRD